MTLRHGRSDRGVGIKYGPDVTTKFCSQNRLRLRRWFFVPPGPFAYQLWSCQVPGTQPSGAGRWAKLATFLERWFLRDFSVNYYKLLGCFCCFSVCCFCQARISEAAQWSLCDRVQCQQLLWRWRVRIPSAKRCCVWVELSTTRWWFEHIFYFYPLFGKDSHFDYITFFNWVGSTTN